MSHSLLPPAKLKDSDARWLVQLVADCLDESVEQIDPDVPLIRYGLDSLAAIQLTNALARKIGRDVPLDLLLDHPDIRSIEEFVATSENAVGAEEVADPQPALDLMLADSRLADDIRPTQQIGNGHRTKAVLLTGATGFLGAYLLHELLETSCAEIVCLVRPSHFDPRARIRQNLRRYGLWRRAFERRLKVITGDLAAPSLGLTAPQYASLSRDVDEIYHCAASVNWVLPYVSLRETNVHGTQELLRLACHGHRKPFQFVSSLGVCYSTTGARLVTEQDDMLPYLGGIHLGYAQSKCVAEALVRQAAGRGLCATIHRPTLIAGDSRTGASNPDDLLSLMIKGCIQMGSAPDLDWVLDASPVDHVAKAIAGLSRKAGNSCDVFHLRSKHSRHWRELVLWMNLFGYKIKLVSYPEWLHRLEETAHDPAHALHRIRSFFLARPPAAGGRTLPELFEQRHRNRVSSSHTEHHLAALSLESPLLDLSLLERYFNSMIRHRTLAPPSVTHGKSPAKDLDAGFFQHVLRRHFGDDTIRVTRASAVRCGEATRNSITTEFASWRHGAAGFARYRAELDRELPANMSNDVPESLDMFVKRRPSDDRLFDVAQRIATVCDEDVGAAFDRHRHRLGLAGSAEREAGIYAQRDKRFQSHAPRLLGHEWGAQRRESILVLEFLAGSDLKHQAPDAEWPRRPIVAALQGIAQVHAIWYGREQELRQQAWLGPATGTADMVQMTDLWTALLEHAEPFLSDWLHPGTTRLLREWISRIGQWWNDVEQLPRTLIHNDFNPRNIALRNHGKQLRLCAFDWELATLGLPQHDLAELLCCVLAPPVRPEDVSYYLDVHRGALALATGRPIDPEPWRLGLELALMDLILNRFPMYCLIHRFRRQSFLKRTVQTWQSIYEAMNRI